MASVHRANCILSHVCPERVGGPFARLTKRLVDNSGGTASSHTQAPRRRHNTLLKLAPEVSAALQRRGPVVALESTIISHGMPYPQNLETAKRVEAVIRSRGAVPATIAILDGMLCVGLDAQQLEKLARTGTRARKVSRRDVAAVVARQEVGATTVASTMLIAHMAGIDVFVTGGIGGVHRGVETHMDISADLTELGQTPVCVVSAGVKSILDVPRTMEYLETQGVPVYGLNTDQLPAFFTRRHAEDLRVNRLDSPADMASIIHTHSQLGLKSGLLFTVPIPEQYEAEGQVIQEAIDQALGDLEQSGVKGKDSTPFLLARVNQLTKGASLASNIQLVLNNARQGADVAVALSKLRGGPGKLEARDLQAMVGTRMQAVVVGGVAVDLTARPAHEVRLRTNDSVPAQNGIGFGGVAGNVCEAMARSGSVPVFVSAVGNDAFGALVRARLTQELRVDDSHVLVCDQERTATYLALLDDTRALRHGLADMSIFERIFDTPRMQANVEAALDKACGSQWTPNAVLLVMDGNLSAQAMAHLCTTAQGRARVVFEPTSCTKAKRAVQDACMDAVWLMSPNAEELEALCEATGGQWRKRSVRSLRVAPNVDRLNHSYQENTQSDTRMQELQMMCRHLLDSRWNALEHLIVKMGADGLLLSSRHADVDYFYPAIQAPTHILSVTGCGDSLLGALCAALCQGKTILEGVRMGVRAAWLALSTEAAVSTEL